VDARWKPVITDAATAARAVKDAIGVYLIAEKRRRDEAAAEVRADTGAEVEASPVKTRGAARAVTLRTVKRAEITDLPALAGVSRRHGSSAGGLDGPYPPICRAHAFGRCRRAGRQDR